MLATTFPEPETSEPEKKPKEEEEESDDDKEKENSTPDPNPDPEPDNEKKTKFIAGELYCGHVDVTCSVYISYCHCLLWSQQKDYQSRSKDDKLDHNLQSLSDLMPK